MEVLAFIGGASLVLFIWSCVEFRRELRGVLAKREEDRKQAVRDAVDWYLLG